MSPRTKNRLVLVALLLGLLVAAVLLARSAPRDDAPALAEAFRAMDGGGFPGLLLGTALHERWDLPGIMEASQARRNTYGDFVRVVSSGEVERIEGAGEPVERRRFRVAFTRREADVTAAFVRRNGRWVLQDLVLPMPSLPPGAAGAERGRQAARAAAEHAGRLEWETLLDLCVRELRLSTTLDEFRTAMTARLGAQGAFREVVEESFSATGAEARFEGRIEFDAGPPCPVRLRLRFVSEVARWKVAELTLRP